MLEYFVHLDQDDTPDDLVLAIAEVPDDVSHERVTRGELPATWRHAAAPPDLALFGDQFAKRGKHCLLWVPSAIAIHENNCLINPEHPDYKCIVSHELEPLRYDPRMFGKRRAKRDE